MLPIDALLLARHRELENRSIKSIVQSLGRLSAAWLKKDFFYRKKALQRLVKTSGFTLAMSEALLDSLFSELTEKKLWSLLHSELGDPLVLDRFRKDALNHRQVTARGPKLIVHIFSANVPNPSIISFVLGMLLKSANIGKVSSKDPGFLDIYLESLSSQDARLAATNFLLKPEDKPALKKAYLTADLVIAYGNNETLSKIQKNLAFGTAFEGYGHRASFSMVTRESLEARKIQTLAKLTAKDIWMMDQRGCLSPLILFLEKGGGVSPEIFTGLIVKNLELLAGVEPPRKETSFLEALNQRRLKSRYEIAKLKDGSARTWKSSKIFWTVYYDEKLKGLSSMGGGRTLWVKGLTKIEDAFKMLLPYKKYLQAASLEATVKRRKKLGMQLVDLGFNRICRAGQMQSPPITWHHDGKYNLASWVKWADYE